MSVGWLSRAQASIGGARPLTVGLIFGFIGFVAASASSAGLKSVATAQDKSDPATQPRVSEAYSKLPLSFEANHGQTDRQVEFLARGRGYTLFLTPTSAVLALGKPSAVNSQPPASRNSRLENPQSTIANAPSSHLRMGLVGANTAPQSAGLEELPGKSNYFIGNDPQKWRSNVPNYAKVRYRNVYPGVDLVYYGNQRQLEYDFVIASGADPKVITFAIDGAVGTHRDAPLQIDGNGDLVVHTSGGDVRFHKPVVYQRTTDHGLRTAGGAAGKHFIEGRYVLRGTHQVGFEVSAYDASKPLVIDPVLSYSTYLGGSSGDTGYGIAVDSDGNTYVTGSTGSTDFPTSSPLQAAKGGDADAFVTKLNAAGSAVVYSTYVGGNGFDWGVGIALDSSGSAYVTGYTAAGNFPTTTGAFQTTPGGNGDAFVMKLNPTGAALVYSTYLGGSDADFGQGLAVDATGNCYVTGSTQSANFPTATPLQSMKSGDSDAFLTKVNAGGSALVYSTYLGGHAADSGQAIAVDASGNVSVTGFTFSTDFPTTSPLQVANGGSADAFVGKLNAAGSALLYATYLGGSGIDRGFGIAVDTSGSAYVTGDTTSSNFPTTAGALLQGTYGGNGDAFMVKLDAAGSALVYGTYLGGIDADQGVGIAVDASGNAYLTGYTLSDDFPTASPLQATFGGGGCGLGACSDAFVAKVNAGGSALVYSTYLGGSNADFGKGIAVDASGNAYVAGGTASPDFPATAGVFQSAHAGTAFAGDAFIAKIGPSDAPAAALSPPRLTFADQATGTTSPAQAVTLTNSGSAPLTLASIVANGDFAQTNDCGASLAAGGGRCTIQVTFTPTATGARTGDVTISDDAAGSPHVIGLTGTGVTPAPAVSLSASSLTFADQIFGTTSAARTVTLTNSGSASLTITSITASGDFAQTNSCAASLPAGTNCAISVTFTPTATGTRTGDVSITDDAAGSPHKVALTGTSTAVFSLSSSSASTTVTRGNDSTTFTISAVGPADFTGSISLACSINAPATCAFNPTSITVGQSSTLTVGSLKAVTGSPFNFTVSGTSGNQTASLSLTILFADFSLSSSPPFSTITAGQSATYTLTLTPSNGFTGTLSLSCSGAPQETTCSISPASVALDGSNPSTATITIKTTVRSIGVPGPGPQVVPPRVGTRVGLPWLLCLLVFVTLASLARAGRRGARGFPVPLGAVVLCVLLLASCSGIGVPTLRGTPPGTFTFTVTATSTGVSHTTTVLLTVS